MATLSRLRSFVARDLLLADAAVSDATYERRHAGLRLVLLAHIVAIAGYAAAGGRAHVLAEVAALVVLFGLSGSRLSIRLRATAAALGLYACSAVVVHLAAGEIDAHFHFFFVLALVSLYRDVLPYLAGIAFVLVEHFVVGVLAPSAVFSHPADALLWAGVHAGFVAATSVAHVISWHTAERAHRGERALLTAELERFAAVVDSAGIAIFSEDLDGTVRSWNEAATALFGYQPDEVVGVTANRLIGPDRRHELQDNLACVRAGGSRSYETVRVTKDGRNLDVILLVSPVRAPDGGITGASVMARDISERKAAERERALHHEELACNAEELTRLAFRDPLTGLANRALFLDRLEQAHSQVLRTGHDVALLMIDLDGFKSVNDTAGHAAGDALLQQVATRLQACLHSIDTIARLGGDEFAVLLEREADVRVIADRVLAALAATYEIDGRSFTATGSVGIAQMDAQTGPREAVRSADIALYASKTAGKNRAMVYDRQMSRDVLRRAALEHALRSALEAGELSLAYQAVAALDSGRVDGFEALLRWDHGGEGRVSPAEFIPIAEETGLIVPIGAWVLEQATREAVELTRRGDRAISIAVNVSVRQLEQPGFPAVVTAALDRAGLPAAQLVLEITESALADSKATAVAVLHEIRRLGVRVAIDDFGTGYSSLDRLRSLPVDQLKIDRSFISEIDGARRGAAAAPVLAAIVAMAGALQLRVVAEGVETAPQLAALRRMGCDLAQGFLLSRPAPAAEAHELLAFSVPFPDLAAAHDPALDDTAVDGELLDLMRLVGGSAATGEYDGDVMSQLLQAVCAGTGLETAFFTAVDPTEGVQRVLYSHNEGQPLVEAGVTLPWERTVCRAALTSGQWSSADVPTDYPTSAAAEFGVQSYCGVPLFGPDGSIVATLCAVDHRGRGVDADAREFLALLSRLISSGPSAAQTEQDRSVVLVDDSDVSRALLKATLDQLPWQVVGEARSVSEAVGVCADRRPDVVLLDVDLPDSHRTPSVAALSAASPGSCVVVLSGSAAHRSAALAAGATAFLTKDQVADRLAAVLAAVPGSGVATTSA
jgi:diguanylate cyclase (GGDEF)-like protein/PAS domain S-box-containing protein